MDSGKAAGILSFDESIARRTGPWRDSPLAAPGAPAWTHVYLACTSRLELESIFSRGYKNCLVSYFYLRSMLKKYKTLKEFFEAYGWDLNGVRIMVDSGAYSAKTLGRPIPHEEYLEFVRANLDYISVPIMMDTVLDPAQTKKDYELCLKTGIDFMYAFHRPEPWEFLRGSLPISKYIGLAPMPKSTGAVKVEWFNKCLHVELKNAAFEIEVEGAIDPNRPQFHLLGSTGMKVLPFVDAVSSDSSSWAIGAKSFVTTHSPHGATCWSKKTDNANHWSKHSDEKKDNVRAWIESTCELSPEVLLDCQAKWSNHKRARVNVEYFKWLELEVNMDKQNNHALCAIPESVDLTVIDNKQMTGVTWS